MSAVPEGAPSRRLLQQFARFPQPGRVKSRLAATVGDAEACAVHEELLAATARALLASRLGPVELWLDRAGAHPLLEGLQREGVRGPFRQRGADLGARMHAAIRAGLTRAGAVVLVGSDCPGLDAAYLQAAFRALESADVVLGPAEDGGYVLIGMARPWRALFEGVEWGSPGVLDATRGRAREAGLELRLLDVRYDVDDASDLRRWHRERAQ